MAKDAGQGRLSAGASRRFELLAAMGWRSSDLGWIFGSSGPSFFWQTRELRAFHAAQCSRWQRSSALPDRPGHTRSAPLTQRPEPGAVRTAARAAAAVGAAASVAGAAELQLELDLCFE